MENSSYIDGILKDEYLVPQNKMLKIQEIFEEIQTERVRQEEKWGEQDWKLVNHQIKDKEAYYKIPTEEKAKEVCDGRMSDGNASWADIILEEFCEVVYAKDKEEMRKELVQMIAVSVAALESLDRNGK